MLLQISAAVAILICGLLGSRAAQVVQQRPASPWLSLGNCFAGGIFIGAGLLHMLADSAGLFGDLYPNNDFPFWAVIAASAILGLMWVDRALSTKIKNDAGAVSGMTLFIVLSLHSVLAGMALGIETHPFQAMALLIAILAHKGSAAFALGLRTSNRHYWRRLLSFSLMTPIGVGLGVALSSLLKEQGNLQFEAIFDAIAAGTFLYVALTEILPKELSAASNVNKLITAALAGLLLMAVLALYT